MIVTFSDFGVTGPYLGQVRVVLARQAPGVPVVDLLADAPAFNPRASAYLLAALVADLPAATVVLGVVDPGVGTERPAVIVRADDRWLVGPGNGLFDVVAKRARARERWSIRWRPERLSRTFQGRDLFAPVAARIAHGEWPEADPFGWGEGELDRLPDDLPEVVYVDPYGNAMTGLRASVLPPGARIEVGGVVLEPSTAGGGYGSAGPSDAMDGGRRAYRDVLAACPAGPYPLPATPIPRRRFPS